jgi:hypothetical protein
MKSDESKPSDVLMEKVDEILRFEKERGFLSRFDMMFSVLVSISLFATGLMVNNIRPIDISTKFLFSTCFSLFVLFVYVLAGEFLAILSDDAVKRFGYWIVLVWGVFMLVFLGSEVAIVLVMTNVPIFVVPVFSFAYLLIGLALIIGAIFLSHIVDKLYDNYIGKLCYRSVPKSNRQYLKPTIRGITLFAISFATSLSLVLIVFP